MEYISTQKTLIMTLRSIGDAVAFIYGDRHELKQLAHGGDAGFITGKRGTRLERAILRASFKWGVTVVMNDLTNNLRRGDITIFRPDLWPDGDSPIMLVEAKSGRGGNRKRAERQQQAANEIIDYIRTDFRESEEGSFFRVAPKERSRHNFHAITKLIRDLPREGWKNQEIESGLHYVLISCKAPESRIRDAFSRFVGGGRQWFMIGVNEIKGAALGYYPFPLCMRDVECLYRFYNGEFVINVVIDVNYVNEVLVSKGIEVEPLDSAWKIVPLSPDENWGERYVTPRAVGQMGGEFLSLGWFIENMILGQTVEASSKLMRGKLLLSGERLPNVDP